MAGVANQDMAKAWDGEEGERWAEYADGYERAGGRHWQCFLAGNFVSPTDRVLDIGCGNGRSSRDLARLASSGSVLGVDLSSQMLAVARERSAAEGLANVSFRQADAQVHPFDEGGFDLAVSSFGAMFFEDPVAAFSNIRRALRAEGRLVVLAWREFAANEWVNRIRDSLAMGRSFPTPPSGTPGPFGLADSDTTRARLTAAGFRAVDMSPLDVGMDLGDDADEAFAFVRVMGIVKGLTHDLDEAGRAEALDNLRALLAAYETPEGVSIPTAAWLITATA